MSEVVAFKRPAMRRNSRRAIRLAIVVQIIEALEKNGGSAHCDVVISQIAADRKLTDPQAVAALRRQVMEVFKAHCEEPAVPAQELVMFRRVYGPDSRRWGFSGGFHHQRRLGVIDLEAKIS